MRFDAASKRRSANDERCSRTNSENSAPIEQTDVARLLLARAIVRLQPASLSMASAFINSRRAAEYPFRMRRSLCRPTFSPYFAVWGWSVAKWRLQLWQTYRR
jgi:hypothetical protein